MYALLPLLNKLIKKKGMHLSMPRLGVSSILKKTHYMKWTKMIDPLQDTIKNS
jgi:hypothetical protein